MVRACDACATLARRVEALRRELETRDDMVGAVQAQCRADVEHARATTAEALENARTSARALEDERRVRIEMRERLAETESALAREREETAASARDADAAASAREDALRRELEDVASKLAVLNARGDALACETPGRSPSAASVAKKVAAVERRARSGMERRRDELVEFLRRERRVNARMRVRSSREVVDVGSSEEETEATNAHRAAVAFGVRSGEGFRAIFELMRRVLDVLDRSVELARVHDADEGEDGDGVVDAQSWSRAAADLRDPDPSLELLSQWIDGVRSDDWDNGDELSKLAARAGSTARAMVFALKRAANAAAAKELELADSYVLAEEAAQVYKLHLAQAESRAFLAEKRAIAAEEASETMAELCADARRSAEASASLAERAERELRRRESELTVREIAAKTGVHFDVINAAARPPLRSRPMAPFPTPPPSALAERRRDENIQPPSGARLFADD